MPNANEQLEQELRAIWQQAANTRKATSSQRIERILKRSRAELSLRDLFKFAGFLLLTFVQLFTAVVAIMAGKRTVIRSRLEKSSHEF
ncbi:MAG: hypothetical protein QJT81_05275 [Candidatus Thiothrix putei]|uniref:Uncharacterized protein n=1 Tax=Candidatus Thiothrix putei TaxID=3080811 RepID=A0AA95HDG0_9GAMM|nr:MAG: hypothetical protein QJT81_05275 [Candidatus Thiothrix putei]